MVVVHDGLPDAVTEAFEGWAEIRFAHCDLSRFDARLGVNDVRYFCFLEQIEQHPEWWRRGPESQRNPRERDSHAMFPCP